MELSLATKCLHLEKNEDDSFSDDITHCSHYGAISFPIYQTSTYAHPAVGKSTGFDYSRMQNPTRLQLEKIVRALEGGKEAVAVSSGMSAISLLMEIFSPGDHIIVDSDLYGGTIRLFDAVSKKNGITFTRENLSS
ncbi:MAG: PLP-dependent aspartate aminotransferase family protein, partial [Treponemataceae bacterium]|nr:PLP-dependent aspartate aminotransferase family protein [Treponemataceae bacterium]